MAFRFSQYLHVWCLMQVQLPARSQKASVWKTPHFPRGHRLGIYPLTKPWYVIFVYHICLCIFHYIYISIISVKKAHVFDWWNIFLSFWYHSEDGPLFDSVDAGHPRWFWVFPTAAPLTSGAGGWDGGFLGWEKPWGLTILTWWPWKIMKDHERSWKIMKDHERSWKIMKDHERSWKMDEWQTWSWRKVDEWWLWFKH